MLYVNIVLTKESYNNYKTLTFTTFFFEIWSFFLQRISLFKILFKIFKRTQKYEII